MSSKIIELTDTTNTNLVDINDVHITENDTKDNKIKSYIEQIKNPYHFKVGDIEVECSFTGTISLEDRIRSFMTKNI